jgi:hypothetical protein
MVGDSAKLSTIFRDVWPTSQETPIKPNSMRCGLRVAVDSGPGSGKMARNG